MKKLIFVIVLFCTMFSCKISESFKFSEIREYDSLNGYKNMYVVDTINIEKPVFLKTNNGLNFVMAQKTFDEYKGGEKFLLNREDVYLYEDNFPMKIPDYIWNMYSYSKSSDCFDYNLQDNYLISKKKGIKYILKSKSPVFFIFILINVEYYNQVYTGLDTNHSKLKYNKNLFCKLLIPVCFD